MAVDDIPSRDLTTALVAAEVRAELGRQNLTRADLARRMGVSQMWMSDRMTGKVAINVYELLLFASALDLHVTDLLPRDLLYAGPTPRWGEMRRFWVAEPGSRRGGNATRGFDPRVVARVPGAGADGENRATGPVRKTRPLGSPAHQPAVRYGRISG